MGSSWSGLSDAYKRRLAAANAKKRGNTDVHVPSPAEYPRFEISAVLEAWREGRPYSSLPPDHAVALLRPPPEPDTEPGDVMSPGGRLMQQMQGLRQRMANDKDVPDFDAIRRDTVRQIEQEQPDAERNQRQRLKRQRRAERKRQAAA